MLELALQVFVQRLKDVNVAIGAATVQGRLGRVPGHLHIRLVGQRARVGEGRAQFALVNVEQMDAVHGRRQHSHV